MAAPQFTLSPFSEWRYQANIGATAGTLAPDTGGGAWTKHELLIEERHAAERFVDVVKVLVWQ